MKIAFLLLLTLACLTLAQEPQQIVYEQEIIEPTETVQIPTPIKQPEPTPAFIHTPQRQPFKFDIDTLKLYKYQLLVISAIFLYLLLYVKGKQANVELMQKFYRKVSNFLQANFAHVGFSKTSGEAPFNGESSSESTYYASGRDNVESIEMKFSTKKRQDLIYMLLDIFMPDKDTVTIDLPVKSDVPLVFAVAQRKRVKELTEKHQDIRMMTRQFNVGNLSQGYEVLGEAADTIDSIIDNYVVKKLNQLSGLIMTIHYTDLKIFSQSTGHLRIVFNLAHKKQQHFLPGLELALYLADKIVGLKISANSKAKALKSRQAYNQTKEKQDLEKHNEQLKKRRQEKLRQQQAWIRSLPPEKQKKEEQKRKKKDFNRMMKGKTMKV